MPPCENPGVFLGYAKSEIGRVLNLAEELKKLPVRSFGWTGGTWWGALWDDEIKRAVKESAVFVACLSKEYNSDGYRQKEIRFALDRAALRPPGRGFIVPFILEPCGVPDWCASINVGNPEQETMIPDPTSRH